MQRIQQGVDIDINGYLGWKKGMCIFVLLFSHIFNMEKMIEEHL
jgi:hypothetical protein